MLNPIRNRIPGCDEHPHLAELERQDMQQAIALDALRRLPVAAALTVVDAYVEGLSGATADPRRRGQHLPGRQPEGRLPDLRRRPRPRPAPPTQTGGTRMTIPTKDRLAAELRAVVEKAQPRNAALSMTREGVDADEAKRAQGAVT